LSGSDEPSVQYWSNNILYNIAKVKVASKYFA